MDVTLTAKSGRATGSRAAGRLRREGKVPGVVYGLGHDPVAVSVEWPELRQALTTDAGVNALITLEVDGDSQLTIVKELQRDPVRRDVIHVDFIALDASQQVTVEVPINLIGEALEVNREGGLVDQTLYTLEISARPDAIPNELELDVSDLTVGANLHVSDLTLPAGVTTAIDPEEVVASGQITRAMEEAVSEDEEALEGEEAVDGEDGEAADGEGAGGGDNAGSDGD